MKMNELKPLGKNELESKLAELKKELMKINAQASVTTPKSPGKIKHIKKTIARIITLLSQKAEIKGGKRIA